MSAYDTQIITDDMTLTEAFAAYNKTLEKFCSVFTAIVDQNIETNKVIVETVELQKEVLLNGPAE